MFDALSSTVAFEFAACVLFTELKLNPLPAALVSLAVAKSPPKLNEPPLPSCDDNATGALPKANAGLLSLLPVLAEVVDAPPKENAGLLSPPPVLEVVGAPNNDGLSLDVLPVVVEAALLTPKKPAAVFVGAAAGALAGAPKENPLNAVGGGGLPSGAAAAAAAVVVTADVVPPRLNANGDVDEEEFEVDTLLMIGVDVDDTDALEDPNENPLFDIPPPLLPALLPPVLPNENDMAL